MARPIEEGAKNQLWAATAEDVVSGELYYPIGMTGKTAKIGRDEALAKKLWDWTQKELKEHDL